MAALQIAVLQTAQMNSIDKASIADAPTRLIRLPEVMARTGLARPTIYKGMMAGRFPPVIRVGRAAMWVEKEIDQWVSDRIIESRAQEGLK